eukprot:12962123-Alexandrium_andersonii.AAC.1
MAALQYLAGNPAPPAPVSLAPVVASASPVVVEESPLQDTIPCAGPCGLGYSTSAEVAEHRFGEAAAA